jgi:hypothetical protein
MSSFSSEERQRIIRETNENLANRINPPSDEEIIARARQAPIESPMDRWRRQAAESDAAERRAEAEFRREESTMRIDGIVNQLRAEFRAELKAAIALEHSFMVEVVGGALGEFSNQWADEARSMIKAQSEKMNSVFERFELQIERLRSDDRSPPTLRAVN